jgi:hypothetical protein
MFLSSWRKTSKNISKSVSKNVTLRDECLSTTTSLSVTPRFYVRATPKATLQHLSPQTKITLHLDQMMEWDYDSG